MAITKDQLRIHQAFMSMPYGGNLHFVHLKLEKMSTEEMFIAIANNLETLVDALKYHAEHAQKNEDELRNINVELQCVGSLLNRINRKQKS